MSEVYLLSVKCEYLRFFQVINRGICVSEVYLTTEAMCVGCTFNDRKMCIGGYANNRSIYISEEFLIILVCTLYI